MLPFTPNPTPTTSPTVTTPSVSPPPSYSGSSTLDTGSESSPRKSHELDSPYHQSEYHDIILKGSRENLSVGGTSTAEEAGETMKGDVDVNGLSRSENGGRTHEEDKGEDVEIDGNVGSVWL